MSIGILDYGAGNIGSLLNMFRKLELDARVASAPDDLSRCSRLVLPGVGAFDQAMKELTNRAFREGKLPFPDGAIIAALHWNEASSEENNKVLAIGFPNAGLQSSVAGSATNVQFMVKDSKKYAATGGWGFADFKDGKPGDEALHKTCFPCHQPAKAQDYVFTHYARTP